MRHSHSMRFKNNTLSAGVADANLRHNDFFVAFYALLNDRNTIRRKKQSDMLKTGRN